MGLRGGGEEGDESISFPLAILYHGKLGESKLEFSLELMLTVIAKRALITGQSVLDRFPQDPDPKLGVFQ